MVGPALLAFEALVVALAIPVALTSGRGAAAGWALAGLAVLLVLAAGAVRSPRGMAVGWVLQLAVLLTGLLVPAMFVLGLVFLAVWITAVVVTGKAERIAAARRAGTAPTGDGGRPDAGTSQGG